MGRWVGRTLWRKGEGRKGRRGERNGKGNGKISKEEIWGGGDWGVGMGSVEGEADS